MPIAVAAAGNVLLKSDEVAEHGFSAKIADFGLSRMTDDDQEPDMGTGTSIYKSPESLNSGVYSKVSPNVACRACLALHQLHIP